jgi:phage head maturation protease
VSAISRGDLNGMSWAFNVDAAGERWNDAQTERTILSFSRVPEISVVWMPAYSVGTSVSTVSRAAVEAAMAERRRVRARGELLRVRQPPLERR